MPVVSFPWDAQLVSLRRDTVPSARWDKAARAWHMTTEEAEIFLAAAQARMYFARYKCTVTIDTVVWIVGFAQGAPYRFDQGENRSSTHAEAAGSTRIKTGRAETGGARAAGPAVRVAIPGPGVD